MEGWQWFRVWCDRRLTTKKQKEGEDAAQPILIGNEKVKKEEGETWEVGPAERQVLIVILSEQYNGVAWRR